MTPRDAIPAVPVKGRPDPGRRETLWSRVDRNRLLLVWYLALFAVGGAFWFTIEIGALLLIVSAGALRAGMYDSTTGISVFGGSLAIALVRIWLAGLAIAIAYEVSALVYSEKRITEGLGAKLVPKGELYDTKMVLKDMAIASGLMVAPALYMMPGIGTNAFVAKAFGRRPVVGITRKFVTSLSLDEQRAVFANLVARLRSNDVLVSTAVTGLLAPLEAWREKRLLEGADDTLEVLAASSAARTGSGYVDLEPLHSRRRGYLALFLFSVVFIFLGEVVAAVHRHSQLRAAEKADAEGMLLLKDPGSMLAALQRCVELDNVVSQSGSAFGELFYCWPGDATNDEEDPEWTRVARLREVLGVDGWVYEDATGEPSEPYYPTAPRMERDA